MSIEERNISKEIFLKILREVTRPGVEDLISYLETTDFFDAPASPQLFRNYPGGLVEHALVRYDQAKNINDYNNLGFSKDSIILTSLLADINKANYYATAYISKKEYNPNGKQYDEGGKFDWKKVTQYLVAPVDQRIVFGTSGQNAERRITNYIPLSDEESSAIINMSVTYENPTFYFGEIYKYYPLAGLLNAANTLATFVVKEVVPF